MKVQGPGKTQGPAKSKKGGKASAADGSFEAFIASGPKKAAATQSTQSIAAVDALLAVQAAEDPTERAARQRMRKRADDILDGLESVRVAMLGGQVTVGQMVDIADVVATHREKIDDPALTSLMDEIDLRAQVELAKMRVAMEKADK